MATNREVHALTVFNALAQRFGLEPHQLMASVVEHVQDADDHGANGDALDFHMRGIDSRDSAGAQYAKLRAHLAATLKESARENPLSATNGGLSVTRSAQDLISALEYALDKAPVPHSRMRSGPSAPAR